MSANPFAADIHPDGYAVEGGAHVLHSAALGTLLNIGRASQIDHVLSWISQSLHMLGHLLLLN